MPLPYVRNHGTENFLDGLLLRQRTHDQSHAPCLRQRAVPPQEQRRGLMTFGY